MNMGVPSSVVRGFCIARAGCGSEAVAKVWRVNCVRDTGHNDVVKADSGPLGASCIDGARKSRYNAFCDLVDMR
jgi:hypothetical protein